MNDKYSMIEDISIVGSGLENIEDIKKYFENGYFEDDKKAPDSVCNKDVSALSKYVDSPLKKRMSSLSIGICASLALGPGKNLTPEEEIYLFTAFAEIDTTNKIISSIKIENSELVSPTLFHNSVHNTPLGYFTILHKLHNYCLTISDGLDTGVSFANFIKRRALMAESFVVTSGEEYSEFYELDYSQKLEISPIFCSYRVVPFCDKGFRCLDPLSDVLSYDFSGFDFVFTDRSTYSLLKGKVKNVYTEYFLTGDNPSSVVARLSIPFILGLKGKGLIIDKNNDKYLIFEVNL